MYEYEHHVLDMNTNSVRHLPHSASVTGCLNPLGAPPSLPGNAQTSQIQSESIPGGSAVCSVHPVPQKTNSVWYVCEP